jgi:Cu/Ag efflux pump CusA
MAETVETKLARIEEKLEVILKRLENGDANFKEFEKRIASLEKQVYAGALIITVVWALFLLWIRQTIGA